MRKPLALVFNVCAIALAVLWVAGCATHRSQPPAATLDDINEYRQIIIESRQAMDQILPALDQVAECGTSYPPALAKSFSREVENINVGSVNLRAHARAIAARGDAYFDTWWKLKTQIEQVPERRKAEEQRPLLLASFHRLEKLSAQNSEAFNAFLSELQDLESGLQQNPQTIADEATRNLIGKTQADGHQVARLLDLLQNASDDLAAQAKSI